MPFRPPVTVAQVIGHHADRHAVDVVFTDGTSPGVPFPVVSAYGDALRSKYDPLPGRGQLVVVAFPAFANGETDERSGVVLGTIYPAMVDAITGASPFEAVENHWSGLQRMTTETGDVHMVHPSGTRLSMAPDGTANAPYPDAPAFLRHIVDSNEDQQSVAFSSDDLPTQGAVHLYALHSTGTYLDIDESGNVTVADASVASPIPFGVDIRGADVWIDASGNLTLKPATSASVTVESQDGTASFKIDGSGNVTLNPKSGSTLTITASGATISVDGSGNVTVDPTSTLTLAGGGEAVARANDPVMTAMGPGYIESGSTKVSSG